MSTTQIPKIGTSLNVYTLRQIRYQGKLVSINPETRSLTLESVRSFGTEDRVQDRDQIVRGQPQVYDRVEFNAENIFNIKCAYRGIEDDPAVLNQPVVTSRETIRNVQSPQYNRVYHNNNRANQNHDPHMYHSQQTRQNRQRFGRNFYGNPQGARNERSVRGRDGQFRVTGTARVAPEFLADFDFAKANEDFNKEPDVVAAGEKTDETKEKDQVDEGLTQFENTVEEPKIAYTGNESFFDGLSIGGNFNTNRNKESAKNLQTFGRVFPSQRYFPRHNNFRHPQNGSF